MITEYPIEDLIIISGVREQKKESQPIAKVMSEQVKMPDRHFYLLRHYLCYRLAFFFSSVSAKLNQKVSHICQVQSDTDNSFEF